MQSQQLASNMYTSWFFGESNNKNKSNKQRECEESTKSRKWKKKKRTASRLIATGSMQVARTKTKTERTKIPVHQFSHSFFGESFVQEVLYAFVFIFALFLLLLLLFFLPIFFVLILPPVQLLLLNHSLRRKMQNTERKWGKKSEQKYHTCACAKNFIRCVFYTESIRCDNNNDLSNAITASKHAY